MNYIPQIAIALLFVIGIALAVAYFLMQKKKHAPLTPQSIPPLPTPAEATQHFATANATPQAVQAKKSSNKKTIVTIAVIVNVLLLGGIIAIGTKLVNKPKSLPTSAHVSSGFRGACGVNIDAPVEVLGPNGSYDLTAVVHNTNDYGVTITVKESTFFCSNTLDPNASGVHCSDNGNEQTNTYTIPANGTQTLSKHTQQPAGACGSFQTDFELLDVQPPPRSGTPSLCNDGHNHPVFGINSYAVACTGGVSPTPAPTSPAGACSEVSGLVMELQGAAPTPAACPPPGATGKNGVVVTLDSGSGTVASDTTSRRQIGSPPVDTDGVFRINVSTLPPGIYNVCAQMPAGDTRYCNINRVDNHDPYTTQCAKIDTRTPSSCAGNRLVFSTAAGPSPTSGPSPTAPVSQGTQVSGQVFNVGFTRPNQCVNEPAQTNPTPYPGVNGVTMTLKNADSTVSVQTKNDTLQISPTPVNADGVFRFNNVLPGTYSLCMETRQDFYCANTSPDTFNTQVCKTVTVASTPSAGHRFAIKQSATLTSVPGPTSTPVPTATSTPVPTSTTAPGQPTSTPAPTATPVIRYITATPVPTEIVLVQNVTQAPASGNVSNPTTAVTIPPAGVPLPAVAVAVPVILVILAFVL